jgi:CubicO group peptidase (beta-lactamase class C family)
VRGTKRRGKIVVVIVIIVAIAVLVPLGSFLYTAVPGGTSFAAKQLCSLVFVSGLDPERAMETYVEAVISPLGNSLHFEVDRERRTVHASSFFGLVEAEAAHRRGCGCTALHESTAEELRAAFTPMPTGQPDLTWEIDAEHRGRFFEEAGLDRAVEEAFAEPDGGGRNTLAVLVLHEGRLVAERYAPGIDATTPLVGWSMTKSVMATLVGILVREGRLDVNAPAGFPEWSAADDPRRPITLDLLLRMTAGLDIVENQSGADPNTVMLYLQPDGAGYSASRSLYTEPNTDFKYMSGCTALASRRVREAAGGTLAKTYAFVHGELFDPLGMTTAVLEPDESGTFMGSSFMLASARDWARFGQLYLQRGVWRERRIVTEDWIDYVTTPTALSPDRRYGAGFWLNTDRVSWPDLPADAFAARGFQGQIILIIPSRKLVVVRLGASRVASRADEVAAAVIASLRR